MTNAEDRRIELDWLPWDTLDGGPGTILDLLTPMHQSNLSPEQKLGLDALISVLALYPPHEMKGMRAGFQPENVFEAIELPVLRALVAQVPDTASDWVRARVLHVAWERRRSCSHAQVAEAVEAYLRHATAVFDPVGSNAASDAIELAARLGGSLGRDSTPHKQALAYAQDALVRLSGHDPGYFSERLLELLLEFGCDEPRRMAALAEHSANAFPGDHDRTAAYLRVAARFWGVAGDHNQVRRVVRLVAVTLEAKAAAASPLVRAAFLKESLAAYRELPDGQADAERLIVEIEKASAESMKHMGRIDGGSIDLTDSIRKARQQVSGRPFMEALAQLCLIHHPAPTSSVEERVREIRSGQTFRRFIPIVRMARDGRVVVPATDALGAIANADLHEDVVLYQSLAAQGLIFPALSVVRREHGPSLGDFISICHASPFVPERCVYAFAQGLRDGFYEDFEAAVYRLVPHVENAIRVVFQRRGVVTTSVRDDGTQMYKSLNALLEMPEAMTLFGDARRLDLEALLTSQAGFNLRNDLAHGLLTDGEKPSYVYLWWSALCLVVLPLIADRRVPPEAHVDTDTLDSPGDFGSPDSY